MSRLIGGLLVLFLIGNARHYLKLEEGKFLGFDLTDFPAKNEKGFGKSRSGLCLVLHYMRR